MVVLGFACNRGKYTAVVRGKGLPENDLKPAQPGSFEYYFHKAGLPRFILDLRRASPDSAASAWLTKTLDFRSIGALAMEEQFHPIRIHELFDALVYLEETTATELLRPRAR
jgi:erythromycin esterase-like protein